MWAQIPVFGPVYVKGIRTIIGTKNVAADLDATDSDELSQELHHTSTI